MRLEKIVPGRPVPRALLGAVLARDLVVARVRWPKGRRLTESDLVAVEAAQSGSPVSVLVPEPGEVHEDDAALRLAAAVARPGGVGAGGFGPAAGSGAFGSAARSGAPGAFGPAAGSGAPRSSVAGSGWAGSGAPASGGAGSGAPRSGAAGSGAPGGGAPGLAVQAPAQSRVDLVATLDGVISVRVAALERLNRLDPLQVFTVFDGQVVAPGDRVASVKIGPHLVAGDVLEAGERIAASGAPIVALHPFREARIGVLVKEHVAGAARDRFEATVRAKAAGLGATVAGITYVPDEPAAVAEALAGAVRAVRGAPVSIVLAAGGASTDPADPFFLAVTSLGGRIVRHGVPAHPGSMLWLGRVGRVAIVGLPSCGAFSKATAADLLLPWLVAGLPASAATVARLGHGGILTRSQRFRFPAYARDLDAPDG